MSISDINLQILRNAANTKIYSPAQTFDTAARRIRREIFFLI